MKKIIVASLVFSLFSGAASAQKYMTRTGKITFDATSPSSPEKIAAVNNEVASIFNGATGDMVFQAQVKSFKFEKELMEQHFNENYMESGKFPKAEFKGKVADMSGVNLSKDGTYNVTVAGQLAIHGVTKEVSVPGTITVKGKDLTAKTSFKVKLADYKIEVPSIVTDKLAKEATIKLDAILNQK